VGRQRSRPMKVGRSLEKALLRNWHRPGGIGRSLDYCGAASSPLNGRVAGYGSGKKHAAALEKAWLPGPE